MHHWFYIKTKKLSTHRRNFNGAGEGLRSVKKFPHLVEIYTKKIPFENQDNFFYFYYYYYKMIYVHYSLIILRNIKSSIITNSYLTRVIH